MIPAAPDIYDVHCLAGKSGCGKSYVLLQAVQYSIQKEWISLYIPRGASSCYIRPVSLRTSSCLAINLVNSSTPYAYDPRTQTYGQPAFAQQLLKRFVDVNEALIQGMKVQGTYPFEERTIDSASSLMDLINLGLEVQSQAPTVLNALLTELSQQTKYGLVAEFRCPCADRPILTLGSLCYSRSTTSRRCTASRTTAIHFTRPSGPTT